MNPSGPTTAPTPRGRWEIPFVTAVAAATIWVACFLWTPVWQLTGIGEGDKPFLDLRNLISAGESAQLGFDPYVKNPLDPYNRPHGYSDWWLVLGKLGIDHTDTAWIGTLLLACTLAASVCLVRPGNRREGMALLLVLVSPALLMAAQRANHDLVVFVLMGVGIAAIGTENRFARVLGVALLAFAAVLKYFPLAAVVLLLQARSRRELLGWIATYVLVLTLALPSLERGFQVAVTHKPAPDWLYAFGAPVVFRNFDLPSATLAGWLLAGLLLGGGVALWRPQPGASGRDWATPGPEFAGGAVMIVGCFLHGSTYLYKFIFAVWLLRGLWSPAESPVENRWRQATGLLLLVVLWFEGIAATALNLGVVAAVFSPAAELPALKVCLFIAQLLTWGLVICLWRYLVVYLDRRLRFLAKAAG